MAFACHLSNAIIKWEEMTSISWGCYADKAMQKGFSVYQRWSCVCSIISYMGTFQQNWQSGVVSKKSCLPMELWFSTKCLPAQYWGSPWDLLWKTDIKRSSYGKWALHKDLQIWISTWRLYPAVNFSFSSAKPVAFAWVLVFTLSPQLKQNLEWLFWVFLPFSEQKLYYVSFR